MKSEKEAKRLSFDVHGEFITQLAREWFYTGEKSYEKVIELLMNSMSGTDTPEGQIRRYAEDILLGRAALRGSTRADTYHLETYEPGEEELMPKSMNIWKEVEKRKETEKKLSKMVERWDIVMECVPEGIKREIRKALGEETAEDRQQEALSSYVKRMTDETEHKTADYGWLEPDGTFHNVKWGDHEGWANNYLQKNLSVEEYRHVIFGGKDVMSAGDYLTTKGWVLLHNPSMGIAFPTRDSTKRYTKPQKDFLYDYYIERDCRDEANAIWQENE